MLSCLWEKMVAKEKTIFPLISFSKKGFTLLEIMVVMAILAAMVTLVIPSVSNRNREIKSNIRKLTVLSKQLHSYAKLNGATYRLVIDMKDGKESEHEYWVEKSNSNVLVSDENIRQRAEDAQKEKDKKDDDDAPPPLFSLAPEIFKSKQVLPRGVFFTDVEVGSLDERIESGRVFIHYLPQGMVEEAALHLTAGERLNWTIAIHPLTGKADLVSEYISLKEIRDQ